MRRRQALAAAGGLAVTPLLAGCSRFEDGGTESETPTGQWEIRGRVVNEDDASREWLVEVRSGSGAASASGTIPAGEEWAFGLAGQLRDEELEVVAESDSGSIGQPWRPTECRALSVTVTISGGEPTIEESCRSED